MQTHTSTRRELLWFPNSCLGTCSLLKFLLAAIVLSGTTTITKAHSNEIEYPLSFTMQGNPLVRHISSTDPDVHVWDGVVWMYCSQDHPRQPGDLGDWDHMDGYHAFSSEDLVNWTDHGEIIHSRDLAWGREGWMFAPGAARKDGKYYLYYPHMDKMFIWRIGVAIGDSPAGPFKDIGHPIKDITGIDPKIFIDDDGQAYIYNNTAQVARLKPNMVELAERPRPIDYAPPNVKTNKTQRFLEASFMHKYNGKYYYSYTNYKNKEHQGFYAIGDSPYGPFEWKGAFAPSPEGAQFHHSLVEFKGQWYCFYHINTSEELRNKLGLDWNGFRRIACFDRLYYNDDGTIKMLSYTRE